MITNKDSILGYIKCKDRNVDDEYLFWGDCDIPYSLFHVLIRELDRFLVEQISLSDVADKKDEICEYYYKGLSKVEFKREVFTPECYNTFLMQDLLVSAGELFSYLEDIFRNIEATYGITDLYKNSYLLIKETLLKCVRKDSYGIQ